MSNPFAALHRLGRPQKTAVEMEICELCSQPLGGRHRHLLERASPRIICACDACALRFQGVSGGRFELIPREAAALPNFRMEEAQWEDLALPINLVFLIVKGDSGRTVAAYPSPAGVVEAPFNSERWQSLVDQNPRLAGLKPDVEALLINRVGEAREYYIAPIDRCFELASVIRKAWLGLAGGERVWVEIGRFFSKLQQETGLGGPPNHAPSSLCLALGTVQK